MNRLRGWISQRWPELRLSLRVAAAGGIAFALARQLDLPQGFWTVLTAVIVIQASVGGSLKAAGDRLIGTIGGGAYGALVVWLMPQPDLLRTEIALAVALLPLAFLSALRPSFRIAPVTAVILLVGSVAQGVSPFRWAVERVLEIALGSLIGVAVSLLVLPARAHRQLTATGGRVLAHLAELVPLLFAGFARPADRAALQRHADQLRGQLAQLDTAGEEAKRERANHLADAPDPEPLVRNLRRLRYDLIMVDRAAAEPLPPAIAEALAPALDAVSAALAEHLSSAGAAMAMGDCPPDAAAISAAVQAYGEALHALDQEHRGPTQVQGRTFGLAFALEQILRELGDLAERLRERAS